MMKPLKNTAALISAFCISGGLLCADAQAQAPLRGHPFINAYSFRELNKLVPGGVNSQFWSIEQDSAGIMYFGNGLGLIVFDGASWISVPNGNGSTVRSLDYDSRTGRLYAGGVDEMGYYSPGKNGVLAYTSLLPITPAAFRKCSHVWKTYASPRGAIFQTFDAIYEYSEKADSLAVIAPGKNSMHLSETAGGVLYVQDRKAGLRIYENGDLRAVPGGGALAGMLVYGIIAETNGALLLFTRNDGILKLSNGAVSKAPLPGGLEKALLDDQVYCAARLSNGNIALGTVRGGIYVFSASWACLSKTGAAQGLADDAVFAMLEDGGRGLWAAHSEGISRAASQDPITVFDGRDGIKGKIQVFAKHGGEFYLGTSVGMQHGTPTDDSPAGGLGFNDQPGIKEAVWKLLAVGEDMLIASSGGLYLMRAGRVSLLKAGYALSLHRSSIDPRRVYFSTLTGLESVRAENGGWVLEAAAKGIEGRATALEHGGGLWVTLANRSLLRIDLSGGYRPGEAMPLKNYGQEAGIRSYKANALRVFGDGLYVGGPENGLLKHDPVAGVFRPDTLIWATADSAGLAAGYFHPFADERGGFWKGIVSDAIGYRLPGMAAWEERPFKLIPARSISHIMPEGDSAVWFGGHDGLYVYDRKSAPAYGVPARALIRKISIVKGDSLLWGGWGVPRAGIEIPYALNSIAFSFASPSFVSSEATLYSCRLEGFEEAWGTPSGETNKEFTNLPPGSYVFAVKAWDLYGAESPEARFSFRILPPWYMHPAAYAGYALLGLAIVYASALAYARRLKKQNEKLEATVQERTADLRKQKEVVEKQKEDILFQNAELEQQKEEILAQNDKMTVLNGEVMARNEEVNQQKHEIEAQRDNLEMQKDEIERAYGNINTLSEIGKAITSTLDMAGLIQTVYENVNKLMDASAFGIGMYNHKTQAIDFNGFMEKGEKLPDSSDMLSEKNRLSVWCFDKGKEIFINNLQEERGNYVTVSSKPRVGDAPESLIYLPLTKEDKKIGVITVQSFSLNAYSERDLMILKTLASYIVIAIDNAGAYRIIQATNEKVTDSIRYAKTIQQAILPTKKAIAAELPQHGVFFRPKDIVSGDFYWFSTTVDEKTGQNRAFVAAVDCTGHGVPGAFMSLIANTLLNEIVNAKKISSPAAILDMLDKMIVEVLRQEEKANDDGMDVCLSAFIKEAGETACRKAVYCGAKRPLILIPSKTGIAAQLKPTNKSIGGSHLKKRDFEETVIQLENEDLIILSSDGYADQPSPDGRKIGSKGMMEMLEARACESPENIAEALENLFDAHRDGESQRDDVSVIVVRV